MAWISVWQEVDGPKLRKLARSLGTNKAEALGILVSLWFYGLNNADETGKLMEADRWDIADVLLMSLKPIGPAEKSRPPLNPSDVVNALFDTGWLDDADGSIVIHDWDTWQEQWYKLQNGRKSNAERMRRKRAEEKERAALLAEPEEEEHQESPEPEPKEEAEEKGTKPKKRKYAEFVSMTEEEYGKLVSEYGTVFTTACIAELDNYKGSKGKRYKSDYRAVLSWVVDRVHEKRPGLMKMSRAATEKPTGNRNPFEEQNDG